MITGFNTEVSAGGITYHVQTEDMGMEYRKIVTHVFKGGAILMSKKTSYGHLVAGGYDENKIKELMNDQHRTVTKIIQAGKLDILQKKIEEAETMEQAGAEMVPEESIVSLPRGVTIQDGRTEVAEAADWPADSLNAILRDYVNRETQPRKLKIEVMAGTEIVAGQPTVLRVYTKDAISDDPIPDVKVVIKIIGMTFRPTIHMGRTDHNGVYTLNVVIPEFSVGQAAVVVQATSEFGSEDLRLKVARKS